MQTHYQANLNLDYDFGRTSYSPPTTLYLALSTTPIAQDGTGCTEPSSTVGYQRVAVSNDKTKWSTANGSELYNAVDLSFPESTGSWGTITHVAIYDSATGGNVRFYEALPTPRQVQPQTSLMFAQQTLRIKIA